MGRIKKSGIIFVFIIVGLIKPITAQETPTRAKGNDEFKIQLEHYLKTYPFMSIKDTVYTVRGEFEIPSDLKFLKPKKMSPFARWIDGFPIWHQYKGVGHWRERKLYDYTEICRVVHLPWLGISFTDVGIPCRILAEYFQYQNRHFDLSLAPKNGEIMTYKKWLDGKHVFGPGKKLMFKPSEPRDSSQVEFYQFINLLMDNSSYQTLIKNSTELKVKKVQPGDMFIAADSTDKNGLVYFILNVALDKKKNRYFIVATGGKEAIDFYIPLFNDKNNPWISEEDLTNLAQKFYQSGFYRFNIIENLKN